MNAKPVMYKRGESYEWLVIDVESVRVLETFAPGCLTQAYEAADRYNAEAEDKERVS